MLLMSILILVASYLIGSIPVGWLIVKLFKGTDVREVGSSPPPQMLAKAYWQVTSLVPCCPAICGSSCSRLF